MSRRRFVLTGLLRPLLCVIPSSLLIPLWKQSSMLPIGIPMILISFLATATIGWLVGLTNAERDGLMGVFHRPAIVTFSS